MPQLRCPQCGRVSTFAAGRSPVCPACGFGAPRDVGGRGQPPGPATPAATSASTGTPPQSPPAQPPPAQSPPHPSPYARRTDGGAVAALVLGIVGLVAFPLVPSIIAWVLGANAMKRCDADPYLEGRGMAQAGLITGIIGVAFWALVLLFYIFVFGILFSAAAW